MTVIVCGVSSSGSVYLVEERTTLESSLTSTDSVLGMDFEYDGAFIAEAITDAGAAQDLAQGLFR